MNKDILSYLPYKSSFLFVDHILLMDSQGITGDFTLKKDAFFYEDHFVGNPITPGVILTEIMAQIGLVVFGIYLLLEEGEKGKFSSGSKCFPLLASTDVCFYKMVFPGERVIVTSKKQYFRFGKLKCAVEMNNESGELIAKGIFSGIIHQGSINSHQK